MAPSLSSMTRRKTREERDAERKAEMEEAVRRFVADAPPLTPEQVQTIANLLRPYATPREPRQRQEPADETPRDPA